MSDRFDVLLSHAGRSDRQATLRAAFDWSWELLNEIEKRTLACLSVFRGGFALASVAAVIGEDQEEGKPSVIDIVQWLVDKSFIRQVGDERFDLLESVREYAAQHLRAEGRFEGSGPAFEAEARARHWRHFAALDERAAVADRCAELSNLVAGCRAAVDAGDAHSAMRCLVSAWKARCFGEAPSVRIARIAGARASPHPTAGHRLATIPECATSGCARFYRRRLVVDEPRHDPALWRDWGVFRYACD